MVLIIEQFQGGRAIIGRFVSGLARQSGVALVVAI
jgi:hypothetical protein